MSQVPPPPPAGPSTQITGQQTTPSTTVPHTPGLQSYNTFATQTNSLAVVSLVASIASFFAHIIPGVGGATVAVIAVITGFMARGQIKQSGERGMWMANVGIVIGLVHLIGLILLIFFVLFAIFVLGVALFGIAAHGGGTVPSPSP
ncbi:MAG TPA: DUF4190 domain-containing protein [Candidatus Dormibacteraeota bacterium]|nr:DUF4190 domain-containing protein [Candidatus Dormibacteraeota bacterium]